MFTQRLEPVSSSPPPRPTRGFPGRRPAWVGALLAAALLFPHPSPAADAGDKAPLSIFILAGQSNMEGYGGINTLDELGADPQFAGLLRQIKRPDGSFVAHTNVFLYYHRQEQTIVAPVTVGQGAWPDRLGPELAFGLTVGAQLPGPVLLIKTAWGGKDLYCDFRPPGAGKPAYELPGSPRETGASYRLMVQEIHQALDHLDANFPQFKGRERRLAGFVWFQGWNDFCVDRQIRRQVYDEYAANFGHLVHDLRAEFNLPRLPVVVGELGVDGEARGNTEMLAFRAAQAKIASEPELQGTLGYVRTAPFWYAKLDELPRKLEQEERRVRGVVAARLKQERAGKPDAPDRKRMEELVNEAFDQARNQDEALLRVQREHDQVVSHWECHYYGSARVYCAIGRALAEAMLALQPRP